MSQTTAAPSTGPSSYVERALTYTFTLGTGSFGNSGENTVKCANLRSLCTISKAGSPSYDKIEARIYGLTPTILNGLTTLGSPRPMIRNNTVMVEGGDNTNGMAVLFRGMIDEAWQVFNSGPDTYLQVLAWTSSVIALAPTTPLSFPGGIDVATIFAGMATQAQRGFLNSGVNVQLAAGVYLPGTLLQQCEDLARMANINFRDEGPGGRFLIWPLDGVVNGQIPLISPATGLVGYPDFTSQGIRLRSIMNPNVAFNGQIQLQNALDPATGLSEMPRADGVWQVNGIEYDLSAKLIGGAWFMDLDCNRTPGVAGPNN